jgi:hypothetical protein
VHEVPVPGPSCIWGVRDDQNKAQLTDGGSVPSWPVRVSYRRLRAGDSGPTRTPPPPAPRSESNLTSEMNPDAEALRRLTELRLQMIRTRLEREREERIESVPFDGPANYEIDDREFPNHGDFSEPTTSALEILLQAKKERLRSLESHNSFLRAQVAESGKGQNSAWYKKLY